MILLTKTSVARQAIQTFQKSYLNKSKLFLKPNSLKSSKTSLGFSTSAQLGVRYGRSAPKKTKSLSVAISTGQAVVAGSSVLGLGALCYYGLGLSSERSIIDNAIVWPQYVKDRVRATYMYFSGSLVAISGFAYAVSQSPTIMRLVTSSGFVGIALTIGALIATSTVCQSIQYQPGFGAKQISWLVHTAMVGAVLAPLTALGGPLLLRAAIYTAGIAGGISTVAMCAPNEKFLNWGGPLAAGLGVVFLASIGSAFLPPTGAVGLSLYSISMYGGLALFSFLLLYNTQKVIKIAETHPQSHPFYRNPPFDPINQSIGLYMSVINIFTRLAIMMANGKSRRK